MANIDTVIKEINRSVRKAYNSYWKISEEPTIPESFVQAILFVGLGKKLVENGNLGYVTLESGVRESIYEEIPGIQRARPPEILSGRFDILLWHKNENSYAGIELKKYRNANGVELIKSDMKRLQYAISVNTPLKHGIIVVLDEAVNRDTIDRHFNEIKSWDIVKSAYKPKFVPLDEEYYLAWYIFTVNKLT